MTGKEIEFQEILSEDTAYGIIWKAWNKTDNVRCVVKMIMLRTGVHYNQDKKAYFDKDNAKNKKMSSYFKKDGAKPFWHAKFDQKKSMEKDAFLKEMQHLKTLDLAGIGPHIYASWIGCEKSSPVHYGFIAMERGDKSIKELILEGRWQGVKNERLVQDLIAKLHKSGFVHKDLKPSNIICFFKRPRNVDNLSMLEPELLRVVLIDTQKVQTQTDLGSKDFKKEVQKDVQHYKDHVKKNLKDKKDLEREKGKKARHAKSKTF